MKNIIDRIYHARHLCLEIYGAAKYLVLSKEEYLQLMQELHEHLRYDSRLKKVDRSYFLELELIVFPSGVTVALIVLPSSTRVL